MNLSGWAAVLGIGGILTACTPAAAPAPSSPIVATATTTAAEEPVAASAPAPEAAPPPDPDPIPTECAGEETIKDGKACLPPGEFTKKVCAASYPDVALNMFAKGTPWTRAWLTTDTEAWSASGGFTSRSQMAFDEEVLVLSRHAAPNTGIKIEGQDASFDVLRWDGSCVSLQAGELTLHHPPAAKQATMKWNHLEEATKKALLASKKIESSRAATDKACNGDKATCEKAEREFSAAVALTVRMGAATLPTPSRRP
jgi:hypothetical protein